MTEIISKTVFPGSVARGEYGPGSDLDLVLVADPNALPALADALRDGLLAPGERLGFNRAWWPSAWTDVLG